MEKEAIKEQDYISELLDIFRSGLSKEELLSRLSDYHENDIADAWILLTPEERKKIYPLLGAEYAAEIFSYIEDADEYLKELGLQSAIKVINEMDPDDAADILEDLDEPIQEKLVSMLDDENEEDVRMILSYEDDEIGSYMTTNYIKIKKGLTVRQAMHELVRQAGDNDNISTIYVVDDDGRFYGAIDLKDLIIAREGTDLEDLISTNYPYLTDHEKVSDCLERIKDYAEDSLPVLDADRKMLGIITSQDVVEAVDTEMSEDYARLGGLTVEEDLEEKPLDSVKKRLPWLIILLFLGMGVSSVVGTFETVVAILPIAICFQSLILDMAGNVGTQSLAVTIRVLMDENLPAKDRLKLVIKETRVGFLNGLVLGVLAFVFVGLYLATFKNTAAADAFRISACVGFSLMVAMVISSLVGTLIPMLFNKIHIDPAVASGPLITTVNDLVAVIAYYGLTWIILINLLHMGG